MDFEPAVSMEYGRSGRTKVFDPAKDTILSLSDRVLEGAQIQVEDALKLLEVPTGFVPYLTAAANEIRASVVGNGVDVCAILNARSGLCPENCAFCAQSAHYNTGCDIYPLLPPKQMLSAAVEAHNCGLKKFCLVTSGPSLNDEEFDTILGTIVDINRETGMEVNASLGFLDAERAGRLKKAGIGEYNHNLETVREYFPSICTTHTFDQRLQTINHVKEAGIRLCCGGIIGMGETSEQRVELAFSLRSIGVNCVTLNILDPRPGTPLADFPPLHPMEIVKTIAIFRFILPDATIKVAGGREKNLRDLQAMALLSGANGIITGGYLTTRGNSPQRDFQMIRDLGLEPL